MEILASKYILYPTDYDASLRFYRDVLGLAVFRELSGGTVFFAGGGLVELAGHGHAAKSDASGGDDAYAILFQVRDVYAVERDLRAHGVGIEREAREEPWGLHEFHVRDPQGTRLVFAQVPRGASASALALPGHVETAEPSNERKVNEWRPPGT